MTAVVDLRSQYLRLYRVLEILLSDVALIQWIESAGGDATCIKTNVALMDQCRTKAVNALVAAIPLAIDKDELKAQIDEAFDFTYQLFVLVYQEFGRQLAAGRFPRQELYRGELQERFVKVRLFLDDQMRLVLGAFFDQTMWLGEVICVDMLFQIDDPDRRTRSYQDELDQGLVKMTRVVRLVS